MTIKSIEDIEKAFEKEFSDVSRVLPLEYKEESEYGADEKDIKLTIKEIKQFCREKIKQLIEELKMEEKEYEYNEDDESEAENCFETLGEAFWEGRNEAAKELNDKIAKLLN